MRIFLWHAARDSNLKEFYAQVHAAFAKTTLRIHGTALWAAPMYRTSGYKHARGIAFGGYEEGGHTLMAHILEKELQNLGG